MRLGQDSFIKKKLSAKTEEKLHRVLNSFRSLMDAYEVDGELVYATAAFRYLQNKNSLIKRIYQNTNININIISGGEEADIIFKNHQFLKTKIIDFKKNDYLYVDVGGGSTEIVYFKSGVKKCYASFSIGTIRVMNSLVSKEDWKKMDTWINKNIIKGSSSKKSTPLNLLGSGGNIAKIIELIEENYNIKNAITDVSHLDKIHQFLSKYTLKERIEKLELRPDRADVIIPACEIFLKIARKSKVNYIFAPPMSITDGMFIKMSENYLDKFKNNK